MTDDQWGAGRRWHEVGSIAESALIDLQTTQRRTGVRLQIQITVAQDAECVSLWHTNQQLGDSFAQRLQWTKEAAGIPRSKAVSPGGIMLSLWLVKLGRR
jgi:hypothetical protein